MIFRLEGRDADDDNAVDVMQVVISVDGPLPSASDTAMHEFMVTIGGKSAFTRTDVAHVRINVSPSNTEPRILVAVPDPIVVPENANEDSAKLVLAQTGTGDNVVKTLVH